MRRIFPLFVCLALIAGLASGQETFLVNGNFQNAGTDWSGTGPGGGPGVSSFDVTGSGPSPAFGVQPGGNATPAPYPPFLLKQQIPMASGFPMELQLDVCLTGANNNAQGGYLKFSIGGTVVAQWTEFSGAFTAGTYRRHLSFAFNAPMSTGLQDFAIEFWREKYLWSATTPKLYVDNVTLKVNYLGNGDFEQGVTGWTQTAFNDPLGTTGVSTGDVTGRGPSQSLYADFQTLTSVMSARWMSNVFGLPSTAVDIRFDVSWEKLVTTPIPSPTVNYVELTLFDTASPPVAFSKFRVNAPSQTGLVERASYWGRLPVGTAANFTIEVFMRHSNLAGIPFKVRVDNILIGQAGTRENFLLNDEFIAGTAVWTGSGDGGNPGVTTFDTNGLGANAAFSVQPGGNAYAPPHAPYVLQQDILALANVPMELHLDACLTGPNGNSQGGYLKFSIGGSVVAQWTEFSGPFTAGTYRRHLVLPFVSPLGGIRSFAIEFWREKYIWSATTPTLYVDNIRLTQARQPVFFADGERKIGGTLKLALQGNPADLGVIMVASGTGPRQTLPGFSGGLDLSLLSLIFFGYGPFDGSGLFQMAVPIPNSPALAGVPLYWQGLEVAAAAPKGSFGHVHRVGVY